MQANPSKKCLLRAVVLPQAENLDSQMETSTKNWVFVIPIPKPALSAYSSSKLAYEANSRISIRTFYFFDEKKNHNVNHVWLPPKTSKIKQNELFSLNLPLIFDSQMGTSTKNWVFVLPIQKPALSAQ